MIDRKEHQKMYQNHTSDMLIDEIYELKRKIKALRFKECKNCNELFEYKNSRHKFCSDACRIENWEIENGKTLRFFGKKN